MEVFEYPRKEYVGLAENLTAGDKFVHPIDVSYIRKTFNKGEESRFLFAPLRNSA